MRDRLAVLGMLAALGACAADTALDDDGISFGADDGKADEAGALPLIQTNSPFYWAESDYPTFTAGWTELGGWELRPPIASSEQLTTRLQGWVDKIDAMVRSSLERSLGEPLVTPSPIVQVVPSATTFNAWVSGTLACTGATVPGADAGTTEKTLLRSDVTYHGGFSTCARPAWPAATELAALWARHKPKCKLGADLSISGSECQVETYGAPGELSLIAVSPYIHVTTDLIASVKEETLVVVLAHELAHYYRAHGSDAKVQRYDFWYETEVDRKKLPVASALAAELQTAYAEISNGPQALQSATPGHYSPRLRHWLLSAVAPLIAERQEPGFVCAAARDALGPWVEPLLAGYGVPTEGLPAYFAFERALAACAPRLDLRSDPSATTLSYGTLLMKVPDAQLPSTTFPFYASLADVLDALNTRAVQLDQKAARLLQRVRDNRIGLYTTEQEADNLALALAVKLGMSPDRVLAAWLDFMDAIAKVVPDEYRAQYEADNAQCRAQLEAEFTTVDASGARVPTFVPIGDLTEPHHSNCYRLFNFWREQKLRNYQVANELELDAGWDALRQAARQLSDAAQ
jgi:hypothetical protein